MRNRVLNGLIAATLFCCSCNKENQFDQHGDLVPLTVMEDSSLPVIKVNNVNLHSEAFGNPNDPMLLVIHGGPGGDYRGNLNFKDFVQDNMYVVFYDQRGSGLSERLGPDGYLSTQVYIDELDGVIEHYRQSSAQKIVLAGHSWGAMLAAAYVNQNPTEITGVIFSEPGGFTWDQTLAYIGRSTALNLGDEATNDFVYKDQIITGSDHNTLDYKLILSTAGDIKTGDPSPPPYWRYGAICNAVSIDLAMNNPEQMDFTTHLSNYTSKVLFAYSELNGEYGEEHAQLVSSSLPNVELVKIMGCGHEMPHYGWANFYPIIQKYLIEIL